EEIAAAFAFAKASPFPAGAHWHAWNLATHTPLADRLLQDVEAGRFDQYQAEAGPGPYLGGGRGEGAGGNRRSPSTGPRALLKGQAYAGGTTVPRAER